MIVMTAMVAWQVFSRYVLNASPSWTEPASIMVMSWFIFLGAAVGVRENFHMGFDVLIHFLPAAPARGCAAISDLAVLVFGLGMVVYGGQLMIQTWTATIPVLHLPGGFAYMPIVAGGVLMTLFALERLALRARRRRGRPRPERRRSRPERGLSHGSPHPLRRLHRPDADRHADRLLPRHLELRDRASTSACRRSSCSSASPRASRSSR